ncbi:MAG: hypothetical protein KME67_11130 [Candidatus Thiodiazotropha sp. (ex Codakia orbicularis)]|nr:hypothetical protein [Candidatus Thiodiazotropha sp. (ex Codakia orbicularis)]
MSTHETHKNTSSDELTPEERLDIVRRFTEHVTNEMNAIMKKRGIRLLKDGINSIERKPKI